MASLGRVLVTGANSQIGRFLIPRLIAAGHAVCAVSRKPQAAMPGVEWVQQDIARGLAVAGLRCDTWVHLAPLKLAPALLESFIAAGGRRVIAFGTTSRFIKAASRNRAEQAYAAELAAAEEAVARLCEAAGVPWTIFRPTLIYGAGIDRNVAVIARIIRTFGVFPLLGEGAGLRQPVHADDLAAACVAALDQPASFNRAYDLCGGETLRYRDMVARIFVALGRQPRFVSVPLSVFDLAMRLVAWCPRYRDFNAEMARRMNQDLVFDSSPAAQDFGYDPRAFEPQSACVRA